MHIRIMRKFILGIFILVGLSTFAQAPEAINYQAVARDGSGTPLVNQAVNVQFEIRQGGANGTPVFTETHSLTTNPYGLFTASLGSGSNVIGDFSTIDWGTSSFYLHVTVNGDAMPSATQLLSVPYALYAKESGNGLQGAPGKNTLINSTQEAAGVNCANGGYFIESGLDDNENGALDAVEVEFSYYICNGEDGSGGALQAGAGIMVNGDTITNTGDLSDNNELITLLNLNGTTLEITEAGALHTVDLATLVGANYTAGSGIEITGGVISNTGDNDNDAANELQTLSLNAGQDSIFISNGNGVLLPTATETTSTMVNNGDGVYTYTDEQNVQTVIRTADTLSYNGTTNALSVLNGNTVILNPNDGDFDDTNELQDITISGNDINISNGTGTTLSANVPSTNQILKWDGSAWVADNQGTGADNWGTQAVVTDGTLTGDGTSGSPLSGFDGDYGSLANTPTITDSQTLTYTSGTQNLAISGGNNVTLNVDDADSDPNNEIELPATASTNDVLVWDGTDWVAGSAPTDADADATNELQDLSINAGNGNQIDISGGTGVEISSTTPTTGDYLYWNGTNWVSQEVANQTLIYNAGTQNLAISGGNNVTLNVNDADSDPNNERISTFSVNGTNDSLVIVEAGVGHAMPLSDFNDGDWVKSGNDMYNGNADEVRVGTRFTGNGLYSAVGPIGNKKAFTISSIDSAFIDEAPGVLEIKGGNNNVNGEVGVIDFINTNPSNNVMYNFARISAHRADVANSTYSSLRFYTRQGANMNEAMSISPFGNIGIGVNGASSNLHLSGTLRLEGMSGTAPAVGSVLTSMDANGNAEWRPLPNPPAMFWTSTNTGSIHPATLSDNVGIGTANPSAKFDVTLGSLGNVQMFPGSTTTPLLVNAIGAGGKYFRFNHANGGVTMDLGSNGTVGWLGTSTNNDLAIVANSNIIMTVARDGEIGVGLTTGMSGKLHARSSVSTYNNAGTDYNNAIYGDVYGSEFSSRGVMGVSFAGGTYGIGAYGSASGSATFNYGVYGTASGGGSNYAGYFDQGDVHVSNKLEVAGSFQMGTNGSTNTKMLMGSVQPFISALTSTVGNNYRTITITGAEVGDRIVITMAGATAAQVVLTSAAVASANTVGLNLFNITGASAPGGTYTFNYIIYR